MRRSCGTFLHVVVFVGVVVADVVLAVVVVAMVVVVVVAAAAAAATGAPAAAAAAAAAAAVGAAAGVVVAVVFLFFIMKADFSFDANTGFDCVGTVILFIVHGRVLCYRSAIADPGHALDPSRHAVEWHCDQSDARACHRLCCLQRQHRRSSQIRRIDRFIRKRMQQESGRKTYQASKTDNWTTQEARHTHSDLPCMEKKTGK